MYSTPGGGGGGGKAGSCGEFVKTWICGDTSRDTDGLICGGFGSCLWVCAVTGEDVAANDEAAVVGLW